MFRIRLSKFKQVIAVAVIPRIFVRDTKQIKNKLNNYTHDVFNFARKSTDSGSKDDEIEKQRQIIEKCFGETPQPSESKDLKDDSNEMEQEHRNIESSDIRFTGAEKYDVSNEPHEPSHATSGMQAEEATVKATTANIAEETLDQRVETIDETPHVEASPQKTEGFNTTPKVIGHDIEFFADEKIQKIDLDDLAKRCVGAPIGNIDEMLIKEMKNMSNNDIKPQTDMNLIKCHGVEKYYSGIFEHFSQQTKPQKIDETPKEPLCLFDENSSVGDNEIKSERITPLHVDAVHLFALDEGSKDYKETCFFRDSSVNLSSEIEEPLLDVPDTISPYESPAMPFYDYGNKEHVELDNIDASKTMYITGTAVETQSVADIPRAEDVVFRNEDTDEPRLVIERQEMDPVKPEPHLSPTARPILVENELKAHDNPNGFGNLSREQLLKLLYCYKKSTANKTEKSHVFTTSTEIPPVAGINPSPNSSISGAQVPEITSKENTENVEMPVNSAISANQNPGEYYNMVWNEHQEPNLSQQPHVLTAENHIMQMFCTQLQDTHDEVPPESEDSIKVLEYPVLLRDPFSYILLEQGTIKNTFKEAPKDKVMATKIGNVTDFIKKDATCTDEGVPLSQILKRIRDKNRLEFCRNLLLQSAKPGTSSNFTCMAPLDSNKQKNSPRPCQPPPKPPKEKCPKPCPPPCPPKKDPCAKLIPFFLNTIIRFDDPFDVVPMKKLNSIYCYKSMLTDDIIERLRKLGETLRFVKVDRDTNYVNDTTCARDFEPWIPIPSWPAPKVEKKRPFVCPKEGCKPVPVPRGNPPKQRPCVGVPKKFFSQLTPVNSCDIIFIHL